MLEKNDWAFGKKICKLEVRKRDRKIVRIYLFTFNFAGCNDSFIQIDLIDTHFDTHTRNNLFFCFVSF